MPRLSNKRVNWSSTTSASVPTTSSDGASPSAAAGCSGMAGTSDCRQASSPWVKVVSMPLPE